MAMYKVNEEIMELDEVLSYFEDNIDEEHYDNMLDECFEEVNILGYTYTPSLALYRVDEVAYNCGFNDWKNSEIYENIQYVLERMTDGDTENFYDIEVECLDYDYLLDLDGEYLTLDEIEDLEYDEYVKSLIKEDKTTYKLKLITNEIVTLYIEEEENDDSELDEWETFEEKE